MTFLRSTTNRIRMLALLMLAGATLSACAPTPEPTPTPTAAFASEEEAFAAAEEVYRAYNDAVNRQRSGDESADPLIYLTGDLLDSEVASAQELAASGVRIVGDSKITSFAGIRSSTDERIATIEASVCLDISDARALNDDGVDVTAPGRSDIYAVAVSFTGDSNQLLLSRYKVLTDAQC